MVVAVRMKGQAAPCPVVKSLQSDINDRGPGGGGIAQSESSPFRLKASNSTSPFENWNLTALSNETADTVILLEPIVNATGFPKYSLPFAVVL